MPAAIVAMCEGYAREGNRSLEKNFLCRTLELRGYPKCLCTSSWTNIPEGRPLPLGFGSDCKATGWANVIFRTISRLDP